jgi:hypothetical protein
MFGNMKSLLQGKGKIFAARKWILTRFRLKFWRSRTEQHAGESKIFRTDAVKITNLTTKRVWKLPTSTQLRANWLTDSLDMVVLPSTATSRYQNCCVDGSTSPKHLGYTLVPATFTTTFPHSQKHSKPEEGRQIFFEAWMLVFSV